MREEERRKEMGGGRRKKGGERREKGGRIMEEGVRGEWRRKKEELR